MKKILISLLMFAFFVPFFAFSAEPELEKILSPEQIKHFKVMKKEGNTLYGVRIQNLENKADKVKEALEQKAENVKPEPKILEKIAGPWETELFEKIKKIGNALWGYKKSAEGNLGVSKLTPEMIVCLKTAIDKKDTAVKTTVTNASNELVKAIDERNLCQKTALDLAANQEIVKAFKVCKENFNKAVKDSRLNAKKYRDEAWKIYQQEVKTCHQTKATATSTLDANVKEGSSDGANVFLDDGGNNLDL